jgi:protein-disulfide isomerase
VAEETGELAAEGSGRSRLVPLAGLGVGAMALLTAIVFIAVGERGPAPPVEGADAVQRLFGGLEQDGDALGSADAPISISIFNDLQCTDCADYHLETIPDLVEDLVRPGEARLEFRHRALGQKETTLAAFAATAAGEQDNQWQYVHLLFLNQEQARTEGVTDEFLERVAEAVPAPEFDVGLWESDRDSPAVAARVESDAQLALDLRLTAAPAAVVEGAGGTIELEDSPSVAEIEAAAAEVE